jgi:hypothetical protein
MKNTMWILLLVCIAFSTFAQSKLKPGFDAKEYATLLEMTERQADTTKYKLQTPYPAGYERVFRSDISGLDNRWDLWLNGDSIAVINVRGTTVQPESWLEDFYSPMVRAEGYLNFGKGNIFHYKLGSDTTAAVHAGFLIGLSAVAPTIVEKINEYYNKGIKNFILMGHSQGAAITYLLRSYLYYLPAGTIPADINFKTYCSAPPKPGNLFYVYDFEYITRGGWSTRVSNILDWVPQMPLTVQTKKDFSRNDPFSPVDTALANSLGFLPRLVIGLIQRSTFGDLDDARDVLMKYLGKDLYKIVKTKLPGFVEPKYSECMDYMVCGTPVVLKPTESYRQKFISPGGVAGIFTHHMPPAYYYLINEEYITGEEQ